MTTVQLYLCSILEILLFDIEKYSTFGFATILLTRVGVAWRLVIHMFEAFLNLGQMMLIYENNVIMQKHLEIRYVRFSKMCTVSCVPYAVNRMLCTICCVPYAVCRMLCTAYAVYRMLCTVCCVPYAVYHMLCAVCCVPYAVYRMLCTIPMLCTVCCVPYAVYRML